MLLTRARMLQLEQETFSRGIPADVLMEAIGAKLARFVSQFFPRPGLVVCYAGKGHNAGDALVAARHLAVLGWRVLVRSPFSRDDFAALTRDKFDALHSTLLPGPFRPSTPQDGPLVQLDALVGLGAQGTLREPLASLALEMNELRRTANARTVAVDLPSGLDPDTGVPGDPCVEADFTAHFRHEQGNVRARRPARRFARHAGRGVPLHGGRRAGRGRIGFARRFAGRL